MDQMLERIARNEYYCFLDGFSGYFQIPIDPRDQEKTTFTCPYGTFAYRRMPFGLCNAPGNFQRCMLAIFHDMVEKTMEVFMDDFSVFGNSFENCLSRLDKMLQLCEDTNLSLNWEKNHFMVKEGIVLGHKFLKMGLRSTEPNSMSLLSYLIPQRSKATFKAKTVTGEVQLQALVDGNSGPTTNIADEAVNEEMNDSFERATTTASSLQAEQTMVTSIRPNPRQHLMSEAPKGLIQVVVLGVNTPQSDKDSLKIKELMKLCTNLQNMVLDLNNTKTTQAREIDSLKRMVKKLEKKQS
nr:reverse transcriptase domain-containing protein [Tanacetum cinerariifolium]